MCVVRAKGFLVMVVVVGKIMAEEGGGGWGRDLDNSGNDEREEERVSLHICFEIRSQKVIFF